MVNNDVKITNSEIPVDEPTTLVRKDRFTTLRDMLEKSKPKLEAVLPAHVRPERLLRMAIMSVHDNPDLLRCTPQSVLIATMDAAVLGLEPGVLGQAYFVPYGNKCQFIPGYRGLIELARRGGAITRMDAQVVREGDVFEYEYGTNAHLVHKPKLGNTGKVIAAYAIAWLSSGVMQFDVMSRAELDAIHRRSKAGSSGPWVTDEVEMQRKTVVRRLCKYLPLSPELGEALDLENRAEEGKPSPRAVEVFDILPDITTNVQEKLTAGRHKVGKKAPVEQTQTEPKPEVEAEAPPPGKVKLSLAGYKAIGTVLNPDETETVVGQHETRPHIYRCEDCGTLNSIFGESCPHLEVVLAVQKKAEEKSDPRD